jgi:hypothetical protein
MDFFILEQRYNENRAHVHVGKKGTKELCKIWLEPEISVEKKGSLKNKDLKEIVELVEKYHSKLMVQWKILKKGEQVKIINIKNNK